MWLIFVGGIHEHQTRDAVRVIGREDANVETAAGRPDQHHRSANPTAAEEFGQLARDATGCPRGRAGIAVAQAGSVVGAHTRESSDIRLDEPPASARAAESRVEDDSRRAVPGAPQMQPVSSDVDETSWRRSRCQVLTSRKPLIRGPRECSKDDQTSRPTRMRIVQRHMSDLLPAGRPFEQSYRQRDRWPRGRQTLGHCLRLSSRVPGQGAAI